MDRHRGSSAVLMSSIYLLSEGIWCILKPIMKSLQRRWFHVHRFPRLCVIELIWYQIFFKIDVHAELVMSTAHAKSFRTTRHAERF